MAHCNGYEPGKARTAWGTVELERPKVRDASKLGFESKVRERAKRLYGRSSPC